MLVWSVQKRTLDNSFIFVFLSLLSLSLSLFLSHTPFYHCPPPSFLRRKFTCEAYCPLEKKMLEMVGGDPKNKGLFPCGSGTGGKPVLIHLREDGTDHCATVSILQHLAVVIFIFIFVVLFLLPTLCLFSLTRKYVSVPFFRFFIL